VLQSACKKTGAAAFSSVGFCFPARRTDKGTTYCPAALCPRWRLHLRLNKGSELLFGFKTNYFGWLIGNCWYAGFVGLEHAARSDNKLSWLFGWGLLLLLFECDVWSEALRTSSGWRWTVHTLQAITSLNGRNVLLGTSKSQVDQSCRFCICSVTSSHIKSTSSTSASVHRMDL